jgi:hypothetical protein
MISDYPDRLQQWRAGVEYEKVIEEKWKSEVRDAQKRGAPPPLPPATAAGPEPFASLRSGLSKPPVNIATSSGRQPRLIEAHALQRLQTDGVIRSHDGAHRGRLYGPFLTNTVSGAAMLT